MDRKESYVRQLAEYLKKNLKKGYTKESLKWALVNQGHSKMEVEKALKVVDELLAEEAPVLETKPVIKYEIVESEAEEAGKPFWKRILGL
jgi:uncharacterized protein Smg (DUF494 family)